VITYIAGDLFQSPARVLVNTVNTVGVMGKGIAKEFKRIYPDMFREYQRLCEQGRFNVGDLWLYKTPHKWILNFPTKKHWRSPSKLEYVDAGLRKFVQRYAEKGITSIAFPMLGCGNGGLDWEHQVQPLMEKYLRTLPIDVFIYLQPYGPHPEHMVPQDVTRWLRSEPMNLGFVEVMEDLKAVVARNRYFQSLDGSRSFDCTLIIDWAGLPGLYLEADSESVVVQNWQLMDIWQQLRGFGFCTPDNFSAALAAWGQELLALFARLPYVRPVYMSRNHSNLDKLALGVQILVPTENLVSTISHVTPTVVAPNR